MILLFETLQKKSKVYFRIFFGVFQTKHAVFEKHSQRGMSKDHVSNPKSKVYFRFFLVVFQTKHEVFENTFSTRNE